MKQLYITRRVKDALLRYAKRLPQPLWLETEDKVEMTGKEVKQTPLGEKNPDRFKDAEVYQVCVPKYTLIDHAEQLRKEFRKGGFANCELYVIKVLMFSGVLDPNEVNVVEIIKKHNNGIVPKRFSKDGVTGELVRQDKQREMFLYVDEEGNMKDGSQDNQIISF